MPVLVWLTHFGHADTFFYLLVTAGATDWVDGWLARRFGWTSRMGAVLDTTADVLLVLVALLGIYRFHAMVFLEHGTILWAIVGFWSIVHVAAFARYGRTASFHTRLAQTGMVLFGVFVIVLFTYGFVPWLYYTGGGVCLLAGVENLAMVALHDEWTPDIRSGLIATLRSRGR